jgi:two-component system, chemotaxis family, protein-glutamate methylesterase/glutaminase
MEQKIKVLVIDDSALMRQLLTVLLQQDPAIHVVGTAPDPLIAREKIKHLKPDVLTLDVEMPLMDGLTFLEKLMRLHPMPVVMVSSLTEKGGELTLKALELGAVDYVAKPRDNLREGMQALADEICAKVHMAARAHVHISPDPCAPIADIAAGPSAAANDRVVAIGASAGGTQAITQILTELPEHVPGIAVVQHMPPKFTTLFAAHLNARSRLNVREAQDGDRLQPGTALIAPGGLHMALRRDAHGYAVRVYHGAPVNLHQPAVDVLFDSAAQCARADALGILLTGMGNDGAKGLLAMRKAGAHTVAQDEATSVIFGMPEQAIKLGAARDVMALDRVAKRIVSWAADPQAAATAAGR